MPEFKLKCYVDPDIVEAVRAATGDALSHARTFDPTTSYSDTEEVPDDEAFLVSPVTSKRHTPSVL